MQPGEIVLLRAGTATSRGFRLEPVAREQESGEERRTASRRQEIHAFADNRKHKRRGAAAERRRLGNQSVTKRNIDMALREQSDAAMMIRAACVRVES